MIDVVGVQFKPTGKIYNFASQGLSLSPKDKVIVEMSWGREFATIATGNQEISQEEIVGDLKAVLRKATDEDLAIYAKNKEDAREALKVCAECVEKNNLDMKLIDSAYTYDRSKLLFYFTADGRVDFRNLVRDLARIYRTRIELRQVGVRDEAKFLGGLGSCGRRCCCSSFLQRFDPVTIKMAKDQNLSLNSSKISGICGRLMCCLRYEQEGYECMQKKTPFIGELVDTDQGRGTVVDRELLLGQVKVLLHDENASREVFSVEEVKRTYQKDKENHRPFDRVEDISNEDE